jgi:hypothetical protein
MGDMAIGFDQDMVYPTGPINQEDYQNLFEMSTVSIKDGSEAG